MELVGGVVEKSVIVLSPPGGVGTGIYGPYRYVPLSGVWFSSCLLEHRVYKSERLGLE